MTSGTKIDDRRVPSPTYDVFQPTGTVYPLSSASVGMRYEKIWGGSDYPVTPPATVFQRYFDRIPFDGNPALPDRPKSSYREVWAKRRNPRRSTVADHPYSMTLTMFSNSTFAYTQSNVSYFGDNWLSVRGFREVYGQAYTVNSVSSWSANDTLALAGKLRDKIAGSDFNMGVFLGEGREALELITNTAIRLRKALSALRRGDIRSVGTALGLRSPRGKNIDSILSRGKRDAQTLSGAWLEMQYGWLPLLKDVRGAAESLAHQLNVPMQQVYRIRSRKPLAGGPTNSEVIAGGGYSFRGFTDGQLIARVSEVNVASLYGLTDPASVLWELTPYSFVADWFIPIGNYLAARGLDSSLTGVYVTTVTRREFFSCSSLSFINPRWGLLIAPNFRQTKITVDRSVGASLGTPRPNFKPLSKVASWQHCANAVALLISRFGGK